MRIQRAFLLVIGFVFLMSAPAFGAEGVKIGVINFQKILSDSKAGQAIQAALEKQDEKMASELKEKRDAIAQLSQQLASDAMVMSSDRYYNKKRELEINKYDYQTLQQEDQSKLSNLQTTYMQDLQNEVVALATRIGKRGGYTLILDKNAAVYYPGSADLTGEIIKEYNKTFNGKL